MFHANDEYFFIDGAGNEDLPSLTPNEDTSWRLLRSWQNPEGDAPYVFHNGALDYQMGTGIKPIKKLPEVLIGTDDFFFSDSKFEKFDSLELPGMVAHPCIYIDHDGDWHENMWHVSVVKKIDCWDRNLSKYKPESAEETPDGTIYRVKRYYLDNKVLELIPIKERLIFRLGGVKYGGTLIHQSLKPFFEGYGVQFIAVEDYRL